MAVLTKVVKRDGRTVDFEKSFIAEAIMLAMMDSKTEDSDLADMIANEIENELFGVNEAHVENIQDMVEEKLMNHGASGAAKAYILYRDKRNKARNKRSNDIISDIVAAKNNEITRENANMNADTPAGMMMKVASERTKEYATDFLLSKEAKKAVKDNILHVHDLDYYASRSLTCLQHPIDKILKDGFQSGHGESRSAKRIETASIIGCISMETIQNEMHGGQAIPAFDFYLAPYVRKTYIEEVKKQGEMLDIDCSRLYDAQIKEFVHVNLDGLDNWDRVKQHAINETVKRVHQSMEAFVHNMNSIHCLPGYEKIWVYDMTDDRVKIISMYDLHQSFAPQRFKAISVDKYGKTSLKYINHATKMGQKDVYKTIGEAGRFVYTTDNHRIATATESGLCFDVPSKIDNFIVPKVDVGILYDYGYRWDLRKFKSRKSSNYRKDFIPLTEELAEVLGMYVADGCPIAMSQLSFSVCSEELFERLVFLMKKIYNSGITHSITTYGTERKPHQIRFNVGKVWVENFKDVCGKNAKEKKVPYFILGAPKSIQTAFLRGYLICDGGIKHGDGYYNASSISKDLVDGLDYLYLCNSEFPHRGCRQMKMYGNKYELGNMSYEISFSGMSEKRLGLDFGLNATAEYRKYNKEKTTNNFYVENVNLVSKHESMVDVYDIGVDDNECFLTSSNILVHNSRGGNQVVFSSINYGTDTSAEGRCVIREILKTTYRGVGGGATAIFPIQIWKKKIGVNYNPNDPNYDLFEMACKVSAKRFFPNFLNLDSSFNRDESWNESDPQRYEHEVATMGCRTRVYENRFGDKTSIGRGNLSFSTINLVRLALQALGKCENQNDRIKYFMVLLERAVETAARQLDERFQFQKQALAKQFPMLMSGMWVGSESLNPNDTVETVINQGTLGIGFIGLAECLVALTGKHHGESDDSQALGISIVSFMKKLAEQKSEELNHNYSILATPAEGLSGKFTKRDKKDFGEIRGVTDRDYYTNSNHVPVYYKCSASHKAKIEGAYHKLTLGGHIFYVEIDGDATHNPQAIKDIVSMMDKNDIGYCSINHNRNRCMDCGFENSEDNLTKCPSCGSSHIDTLQRITGYLVGTTDRWNDAKKSELKDRIRHGRD